jgi:hypothetical protein
MTTMTRPRRPRPVQPAADRPPLVKCFHVTTARGEVFGVAATRKADALAMTAARLERDGIDDAPRSARFVGSWRAAYGTVLWY